MDPVRRFLIQIMFEELDWHTIALYLASICIGLFAPMIVIDYFISMPEGSSILAQVMLIVLATIAGMVGGYAAYAGTPYLWLLWIRHRMRKSRRPIELVCSKCWECRYSLKGLDGSRCPECGEICRVRLDQPIRKQLSKPTS